MRSSTPRIPTLYIRGLPGTVRFAVYRNGIHLETLGTISSFGGFDFIYFNSHRIQFWLKKGLRVYGLSQFEYLYRMENIV